MNSDAGFVADAFDAMDVIVCRAAHRHLTRTPSKSVLGDLERHAIVGRLDVLGLALGSRVDTNDSPCLVTVDGSHLADIPHSGGDAEPALCVNMKGVHDIAMLTRLRVLLGHDEPISQHLSQAFGNLEGEGMLVSFVLQQNIDPGHEPNELIRVAYVVHHKKSLRVSW